MMTDLADVQRAAELIGARLVRVAERDPRLERLAKPMAGEVVADLTARIEARVRAAVAEEIRAIAREQSPGWLWFEVGERACELIANFVSPIDPEVTDVT